MANLNVHLDDNYWNRFKEIKVFLNCNTNEDTIEKIILLAHTHIEQLTKNTSSNIPTSNPSNIPTTPKNTNKPLQKNTKSINTKSILKTP